MRACHGNAATARGVDGHLVTERLGRAIGDLGLAACGEPGGSNMSHLRLALGVLNRDTSHGTVRVQTAVSFVGVVEVNAIRHEAARTLISVGFVPENP